MRLCVGTLERSIPFTLKNVQTFERTNAQQPMSSLPAEPEATALREALLDQLAYLIDEIEAQKGFLAGVPAGLLEGRPIAGAHSIKEMYGILAGADEAVHLPALQQIVDEEPPILLAYPIVEYQTRVVWRVAR